MKILTLISAFIILFLVPCQAENVLSKDNATGNDIRFTFSRSLAVPDWGLPKEARRAGITSDTNANRGQSNIEFGIIQDTGSQGMFSKLVAGDITTITVSWWNTDLFSTVEDVEQLMQRLLMYSGDTYAYVPWAEGLSTPTIVAIVTHKNGKKGKWLIWYYWLKSNKEESIYSVYQDGSGKWLFGRWLLSKDVHLEVKKKN